MATIGRQDLADDPQLADNAGRVARIAEIDAVIGGWTRSQSVQAVMDQLAAARVPAGKVYTAKDRSEEHTSELQSPCNLVCRLLLEKKKKAQQYDRALVLCNILSDCEPPDASLHKLILSVPKAQAKHNLHTRSAHPLRLTLPMIST